MKLTKLILLSLPILYSQSSVAALINLSRANCVNNESISWDPTLRAHTGKVRAVHEYSDSTNHICGTGMQTSWRIAMIHWGEGTGGWTVWGKHTIYDSSQGKYRYYYTNTTNCFSTAFERNS